MTLSAAAVPTMRVAAHSRQIGKFGGGGTSGRPTASAAAPIPPLRRRRTLSRAAPMIFHASGRADCGERGDLNAGETGDGDDVMTHASPPITSWMKRAGTGAVAFAAAAALALAPGPAMALGSDPIGSGNKETGQCLISNCLPELGSCLSDVKCAQSLVCLNSCYGRPDEGECQVDCGDKYNSKAVESFNTCAVSEKKCVPQKQDDGRYPVPSFDSLATGFDTNILGDKKTWYIVAGLNKSFDIFDCQEHFFTASDKDHVNITINWRVQRPNGQFYERRDIQDFYADENNSAVLHNNGNEYLHYQDDWYIPGYKEGEYVFVYYRGSNDAWDGYGGATVYSTKRELDPAYIPELTAIAKKVGVDFSDFVATDNSCKAPGPLELSKVVDLDTLFDNARVVGREIGGVFSPKLAALPINPKP